MLEIFTFVEISLIRSVPFVQLNSANIKLLEFTYPAISDSISLSFQRRKFFLSSNRTVSIPVIKNNITL